MSLTARIAWDDTILPFQLDRSDIRGRFLRLDNVLDKVLEQHDYPPVIEALVCEAVLLTALIGQAIKLNWRLSLQIRGDGPARLIATDFFAPEKEGEPARIRAYASFDAEKLQPDAPGFDQIGKGYFAILIHQGDDMRPYQGITPIAGGSLAACAQTYFAQSEQLPTRFHLSFGQSQEPGRGRHWRGGGIMLQTMPKASRLATAQADTEGAPQMMKAVDYLFEDEREDWFRTNTLLDTVEPMELMGPDLQSTEVLYRLFHEETPRVFDPVPVAFGCTCSEERVRFSLSMYSAKDIAHMTTDEGTVTADCQFCGAHYVLDPASVGFDAQDPDDGEE